MASGLPKEFHLPLNQSRSVLFLTNLPRWGGAARNASAFDMNLQYLLPTALSALVPVIVGVFVTALLFIALLIRMGHRRRKVDAALLLVAECPRDYIWQIPISVVLAFAVASFVAQGCIGAGVMLRSLRDALDVIKALFTTVQHTGFEVVDLFLLFVRKLKELDPNSVDIAKVLPNVPDSVDNADMVNAFNVMKDYALKRIPDVLPLKEALEVLLGRILAIMQLVLTYAYGVYYALLALLFVQILGPISVFSEEALFLKGVSRLWRSALLITFLFLPVATAWLLLGVASAVGLAVSDACVVLADYRRHILGVSVAGDVVALARNPIIDSGLTCIDEAKAEIIKSGLNDALAPLREPVFAQTVTVVLNVSADALIERAQWSAKSLADLIDCKTIVNLSGSLEHIVCGAGGHSTARSIADMWSAFLGLGISLSIVFLLSTLGVRIAWGAYVWPMPTVQKLPVDGAKDLENQQVDDDEGSVEAMMPVPNQFA